MRSTSTGNRPGAVGSTLSQLPRRLTSTRLGVALLVLIAAAAFFAPREAPASEVIVAVTGTVSSGVDETGVFVGAKADLTGYPFSLTYTFDDSKGTNCEAHYSCIENSGDSNNPVISATLTIHGHSFSYGRLKAFYPDTWGLRRLNYPGGYAVYVSFYDYEEYTGLPNTYGDSGIRLDLDIKKYSGTVSPSWEGRLNYVLDPDDLYPTYDNFWVYHYFTNAIGQYDRQQASGTLVPKAISISGPLSPACVTDVTSGRRAPTLPLYSLKRAIKAEFTPTGGINQAKDDCRVAGFDWVQTVTFPSPSPYYECADRACTSYTHVPPNTAVYDPPQYGWPYCFATSCGGISPYVYPPTTASSPSAAISHCIYRLDLWSLLGVETKRGDPGVGPCLAYLQTDDTTVNYFDQPGGDRCFQGSPNYNAAWCSNDHAAAGAALYFTTQLVGVPKGGGPPIPLPFVFTWSDDYNGSTLSTGDITLLSY